MVLVAVFAVVLVGAISDKNKHDNLDSLNRANQRKQSVVRRDGDL